MPRRPVGHLRRRGDRWQSLGTDPASGRQRARTWPAGTNRVEAERLHTQWIAAVARGDISGRAPAVGVWIGEWLDSRTDLAPSTIHRYRTAHAHIDAHIGRLRLNEIRPADVDRALARIRKTHGHASALMARAVLSGALRRAATHGMIPANPVSVLRSETKRPSAKKATPTTGQVHAIISTEPEPMARALWATMAGTGCRPGEALALRWTAVDLAARTITVAATATRRGVQDDTKTHQTRAVPIRGDLVDELVSWWAELEAAGFRGEWVFPSPRRPGRPVTHGWLAVRFAAALERVGADPAITPHAVRHWFASTLMAAGVPSQVVSDILGNSIPEIEGRYGKHTPKDASRLAVERLPARG